ncbi:hypothetical protein LDENG_00057400 [Lucifuga dentata]|nr:hypothetical protein LDENG_00057400 [Lucifuga dentata]
MTTLRCRKCRKGFVDSTCLYTVEATDESSAPVCSIWHVNVDTMPGWILTSIHQAQWTVGKLNCQNCGARLGSFNFITRTWCPCGRETAVHLSKSRVDLDHRHSVHIAQPRRTRPEKRQAGLWTGSFQDNEERAESNRNVLDGLKLNCAAQTETDGQATQSFSFSPLYCISSRRRCSLEEEASSRALCLCPANPMRRSVFGTARAGTDESAITNPTTQRFDVDVEERLLALDQQCLPDVEVLEFSAASSAVHDEVFDSAVVQRRRTIPDITEQEEEMAASAASPATNRLSKREKNRLKSLRRKQRRRERWLNRQLEQEQARCMSGSPTDSDEEEDREGFTCAVCLDVYFSPHSCQPCGHVFCEPCLRTLAKNRPTSTPCPLCRTVISHTHFQKELSESSKTFFPKAYHARKLNFQKASCARWPLPSCHKTFRPFWGFHRQAAGRRWYFTMDVLDLEDMRGWLFNVGLVIVYIHSVNWILAFLFLCFLMYFFFC